MVGTRTLLEHPAYQALRLDVSTGLPIVAFVGAGLSAPAGLPTWSTLKSHLVDVLRRKAAGKAPNDARSLADIADGINRDENYWTSFSRLKRALGKTTYTSEIRGKLAAADGAPIPSLYTKLWRLPVGGILTLNLDSFVNRSFSEAFPGMDLKRYTGKDAGRLPLLLHSQHRFAFNLHGYIDDPESWVFTHDEVQGLLRRQAYRNLLSQIFAGYTVLFVGVSADDLAIGGPLQALADAEVHGRTHYWITDRRDRETDEWAEQVGIRVIPYDSSGGHHVVSELLDDLRSFRAPEVSAPPVVLPSAAPSSLPRALPSVADLLVLPTPEIQALVNDHASVLLQNPNGEAEFADFIEEYEEVIHRAWYTSSRPGSNSLLGYKLEEEVAKGAFGRVYRGVDPNGFPSAIKVLHNEVRTDINLLMSFRRGVQAMRILEEHQIKGMVRYGGASEIPAFVAMEWIEGPNLFEAKESLILDEWDAILRVALDVSRIIRRAHELPERVLHRDIRPANIMLRNGYFDHEDWEVVVLDFDLSTYQGANQKSILAEKSAIGYLAPEQLSKQSQVSTRNVAVDSFGLGMTLLYLCGGEEPTAYQHVSTGYADFVARAARTPKNCDWKSIPRRMSRLIMGATREDQSDRWSVPQIVRELERVSAAQASPGQVSSADLICEEIVARCPSLADYRWDVDRDAAEVRRPSGLDVDVSGVPGEDHVTVKIWWAATGTEDRSGIAKYVSERVPRAVSALKQGGWKLSEQQVERKSFSIVARIACADAQVELSRSPLSLETAVASFNFAQA